MACVYHKFFALACLLASMSLPSMCTDEVASTEIPESAAPDLITTTARMHDEMEESHGSRGTELEEENWQEKNCSAICSKVWSNDDNAERWQKSGGRTPHYGSKGEGRGRGGAEKSPQRNGSYRVETFKGTWQRGDNGSWNGTFEHEVVEGKWQRHNGTWNGTFEREGVKGEWERSHNGTFNKSFERESGEGKWHRSPNGTWRSEYEDADDKLNEGKDKHHSEEDRMPHSAGGRKPWCDCRKRGAAESEIEDARTKEMETHSGGSDAARGGNSEADGMVRGGSDRDDGSDGFGNAALKDKPNPQTEVMANTTSSSNDKKNDGNGFGNAAVLGLAGAGIAAFCVAFGLLCVCCRRSGKMPLTSGAVPGKSIDNTSSSNPGAVETGVVVNTV